MNAKITIIQVTADGEQVSVDYNMDKHDYDRLLPKRRSVADAKMPHGYRDEIVPGETIRQILDPYFKLMDERRFEINKRVQAANYYQKQLSKLSPEAHQMVTEIWEILHGRRQGPALDAVLEQDKLEREQAIAAMKAGKVAEGKQPTENPKQPDTVMVEEPV